MHKVYFRADAGSTIGYGHFIRTLALADMLKEEFDCVFFTQAPSDYQRQEVSKVCKLVELPADDSKFNLFLNYLAGDEIVVLDNYFFTSEYQQKIKAKGCKLVCIDDTHEIHYFADAVINHAPGTTELQFSKENYTRLFLGPEYLLLRKPFREATHNYSSFKENDNVYVCFGGSDEHNLTRRTCELLLKISSCHIDVVVGGAYEFYNEFMDFANNKNISVYRNASPNLIVDLLRYSCLAVVPDSMVFFEACCLRRPIICGYDCDNQMFISQYNQQHKLGCEIGNLLDDFDNKFTKAYKELNDTVADNYVNNQKTLINDTSNKLIGVFKSL